MTRLSANLVASYRAAIANASPNDNPPMYNEIFTAPERSIEKAPRQTETKAVRQAKQTSIVTTASSRP
jgi:hypothetical protein